MILATTETKVRTAIEKSIPPIEMLQFRNPAKYDGGEQPHYGFFREDTGDCIECFTAKEGYELTTHDDYVALATAAMDAIGSEGIVKALWTESKSRAQATIIVEPSKEHRKAIYDIGGNDAIFPRLVIEAPFGRTFKIAAGFYRDACRNLCVPRMIENKGFECILRHTSRLRLKMDEIVSVCKTACNFEAMCSKMNELNNIEIIISEELAKLYPLPDNASENIVSRARSRAAAIYDRIYRESAKLDGHIGNRERTSAWKFSQAVTGYVQHDKSRRNGIDDVERAILAINDDETGKVWSLMQQLLAV